MSEDKFLLEVTKDFLKYYDVPPDPFPTDEEVMEYIHRQQEFLRSEAGQELAREFFSQYPTELYNGATPTGKEGTPFDKSSLRK